MEALGIDIKLLLAQIVNFGIFYVIFKKFIIGPFSKYLTQQENIAQQKEKILKDLQEKEELAKKNELILLNNVQDKCNSLLRESKQAAEQIKSDIVSQAKKEAEEIKIKVINQLEEEKIKIYSEIKQKIISLSSSLVKSVLKDYVDEKMQIQMTQSLLNKIANNEEYESR